MGESITEHVNSGFGPSSQLLAGFAQSRLDEFVALADGLTRLLSGAELASVDRSLELLKVEDPASIARRFTSPLFLHWLARFGRVQAWSADDPILRSQLDRWNNMTVSPTFWPLVGDLQMAVDGGLVLTADPRIALPVTASAGQVRLTATDESIRLVAGSGEVVGERACDGMLQGSGRSYCLFPGDFVVARNDIDPLRLLIRSEVAPERYGTVLEGADPSTASYPDFAADDLLDGAGLIAAAWPEEYDELELMVQIVVPRGIPDGWERPRHSFSVASFQGAVWLAVDPDPAIVAEGLVHEKGHIKLRYLDDCWPLLEQDRAGELFSVGWRTDPRPLVGVLEGVFVHSQIAALMERIIAGGHGAPDDLERRARYLVEVRDEVGEGLEILNGHSALTDAGAALIRAIEARAFAS